MKKATLFILLLVSVTAFSQNTINNFKYVLVPEKFSFSKADNQYGLNILTKLLLQEKGFTAFMSNETMPPEVAANKCNALNVDFSEKNSLFVTKLTMVLKDCQGTIIFKSKEGKSREKDYPIAYDQALRDAFSSLTDYKYDGTTIAQPQQQAPVPVARPAATTPSTTPAAPTTTEAAGVLYAQATPNGYQLIDTTPKKVLSLLKTSMKDYFIAEDGTTTGVVFRKNEEWIYEYYKDDKLVSQKLQIKF